ncbi:hypothetical protein LUZ60_011517 [Juncus effusus]|nr:hypothetical protein LUZ60_011517 [Juncus effusus]
MGRGWRTIIFGKQAQKAASEHNIDTSSVSSSPKGRDAPPLSKSNKSSKNGSKLTLFSAFRANSNHDIHTNKIVSSHLRPPSKSEVDKEEILLQWEAPSPSPVSRSCTPPPLSKLKKNLSSLFQSSSASTPSSPRPRSPSPFSFFKSSFLSTQNRCGICGESMKRVEGERESVGSVRGGVFTADCSHSFHSHCILTHLHQQRDEDGGSLSTCPLCSVPWSQPPFMATTSSFEKPIKPQAVAPSNTQRPVNHKAYNDDEPLFFSTTPLNSHSPSGTGRGFNPIPEAEEEEVETNTTSEEEGHDEYECSTTPNGRGQTSSNSIVASVRREVALVSSGRRHVSYVVAVRVKAPPIRSITATQRAPMDLVTVLELGQMIDKMQTLKQAIRPIIASMGPADRLSIVAFSGSTTKRLMPLRRMTKQGQRSARQIVDRLVICSNMQQGHAAPISANDALKKAKRVLEDRREFNPVATIMLLSENNLQQQANMQSHNKHGKKETDRNQHETNRFAHVEFPLGSEVAEEEDTLKKCMGGLGGVVMQDVRLQFVLPCSEGEVTAVYCYSSDGSGAFSGTGGAGPSIRLGDLYAEQEIELLLELRVPLNRRNPLSFCIKSTYRDPVTLAVSSGVEQPPLLLPPAPVLNSSLHLRNLFVTCRAVTESRRLVGLNDLATALHLLYSARSLLLQCPPSTVQHLIPNIEAELVEIQRRRGQQHHHQQQQMLRRRQEVTSSSAVEGGSHPLTPTSAWRAAEQLAKVAIMRKSQNRVSDLHGFENARF